MRTTLDIDDDVLMAAKDLAKSANKTAGQIISDLVRKSLTSTTDPAIESEAFFGIRPLPRRGAGIVTNELINKIREQEGI